MLQNIHRQFKGQKIRRQDSSENTDIDITPMLDVVFIMLIFFIVSASFVKESGLGINSPDGDSQSKTQTIVLAISENNEIRIQGQLVSQAAIKSTIIRLKAESPDAHVVIRLHPRARTQTMVATLDRLKSANVLLPSVNLAPS